MHYIIGTRFSVKADPRRGFRSLENQFNINITYNLVNIIRSEGILEYIFSGTDKSKVVLNFEKSRDADIFIAKVRNENIPDYSKNIGKIDI